MNFFLLIVLILFLVLTVKYPVTSIIFFLISNLIKTSLMVNFEIFQKLDVTVLAAGYVLLGMIISLSKRPSDIKKIFNKPFFMMLLLSVVLFYGLAYTSSPNYGWQKSIRYFVFGFLMFLSPIILGSNKSDIKKIVWILLLLGVLIGIVTVAMPHVAIYNDRAEERAGFLEAGPLGTAEKAAVASLIAFCFLIFKVTKSIVKIFSIGFIPITLTAVMLTGSRGSLFVAVLCMAVVPLVFIHRVNKKWCLVTIAVCICGLVYAFLGVEKISGQATERIADLWRQDGGAGVVMSSRLGRYTWTLSNIPTSPIFGHGTGSYAVDSGRPDEIAYPHNLILELLYENGLIGASIFIVFVSLIYKKWKYAMDSIKNVLADEELFLFSAITGILFFFVFMQAMKTNDIDGNRFMFFCAGLIVSVFHIVSEEVMQIENYNDSDLYSENF